MVPDPVEVVRAVIASVNDRSLPSRAHELLDPGFVRHDLADVFGDSHGPEGAAGFVETIVAAMPDFRLEILDAFGCGDRVTVLLRMTGTHTGGPLLGAPAGGRSLSANAVFVYLVADGRVAEGWQLVDGLAFHRVAGLL